MSDDGTIYRVGAGEGLAAIAKTHGYLWKTLWEHGRNGALRGKRSNPNQLVEGDEVYLPPKAGKQVEKPTDAKHAFKRKGEPTRLKLKLMELDEPRSNEAYTLTFGDKVIHGTTDGDGRIDQPIPGETASATLMLDAARETYSIAVGRLDPIDQLAGVQQRLTNLGFDCNDELGELGDATRNALKRFQAANGLDATGDPDGATKAKLRELHV